MLQQLSPNSGSFEFDKNCILKKSSTLFIFENGKKLLQCAREGDLMGVIDLLGKGAPITTDWLGTSPLHLAAMNNHYETCEILLQAGVSRDSRTKVDRTPLHFAVYDGLTRIADLLLKHGAEVDCRDMLQMTPLHWAVERGHKESVKLLLSYGANPISVSKFNKTPLSIATDMNWYEVILMLQKSKPNQNKTIPITNNVSLKEQPKFSIDYDDFLDLNNSKLIDDNQNNETETESIDDEKDAQNALASLLPHVEELPTEATLQLLKDHGITMLPTDNTNIVNSAVQSGRKVVLSDAGKLVLKDVNFQKDIPKNTPIILPSSKMKNAKILTLNGNQFVTSTNQNKPNILQKLPIDSIKKAAANAGFNFVQLPKNASISPVKLSTLSNNKNIKIVNTLPIKTVPNMITLMKNSNGKLVSPNTMPTVKGEIIKIAQLSKSPKIIKLKNNVKFLVKKHNLDIPIPEVDKKTIIIDEKDNPSSDDITTNGFSSTEESPKSNDITIERLKLELAAAHAEIDYYKKKVDQMRIELSYYKNRNCESLMEIETNSID